MIEVSTGIHMRFGPRDTRFLAVVLQPPRLRSINCEHNSTFRYLPEIITLPLVNVVRVFG